MIEISRIVSGGSLARVSGSGSGLDVAGGSSATGGVFSSVETNLRKIREQILQRGFV